MATGLTIARAEINPEDTTIKVTYGIEGEPIEPKLAEKPEIKKISDFKNIAEIVMVSKKIGLGVSMAGDFVMNVFSIKSIKKVPV